jgi:cellulose synthase (UDP-forming)
MYHYVTRGLSVWRSEQYNLALSPLWIQAVVSVLTGAKLTFDVTPKQRRSGNYLPLVWPQITVIILSSIASIYGIYSVATGINQNLTGVLVNIFWCGYNIVLLSVIVRAALYKPPADWIPRPPQFIFPTSKS